MKILTASEMQRIDRLTTELYGVPSLTLMENAGRAVADFVADFCAPLDSQRIVILCGRGNNGGDGFVAARLLREQGLNPRVLLFGDRATVKGDAAANLTLLEASGPPEVVATLDAWRRAYPTLPGVTLVIDALLGTGLTRPLDDFLLEVVRDVNRLSPQPRVVAVDLPSGMGADSGDLIGECIRADASVTFTAPKLAHVFPPACERVGKWVVAEIGTPRELLDRDASLRLNLTTAADLAWLGVPRPPDSHKGSFGHVLVIAGSVGKTGAAALAARAALRAGAGLVTVATPESALPVVAGFGLEFMTAPLPVRETDSGPISGRALDEAGVNEPLNELLEGKSVVAVGPGLGQAQETVEFVRKLVRDTDLPMVVDADGLNALASSATPLESLGPKGQIRVLTPHPGEMGRLTGKSTAQIQGSRLETARDFAARHQVIVVLKGFRTLVAAPDGTVWVNPTGNPGMATGGTGDALTGLIAGFLGQFVSRPVTEVVAAAVYIHGCAGDLATRDLGEMSMLAGDLVERIPGALKSISGQKREGAPGAAS